MEKLKLHQDPFVNSNNIYVQSVSTSKSNSYLFANAYGVSEKQAKERGKVISMSTQMIDALVKAELDFSLLGIKETAPMRKNIIDLLKKLQ